MRKFLGILLIALVCVSIISGQTSKTRRADLTHEILFPTEQDLALAEAEKAEVFKILPRGMFDSQKNDLSLRGGGAYYSFTKKSHSYDEIPQIELQNAKIMVGFAGADYGLISDLGELPLSGIDETTPAIIPLVNYQAKQIEQEARAEYRRLANGLELGSVIYKKKLPAITGKTYVLRAVSFDEADTLVVFKIHRKGADGSLIIFWKKLKDFEKPVLLKNTASSEK